MKKLAALLIGVIALSLLIACDDSSPEVRVEEKIVKMTVVVEREKTVVVTPTPRPLAGPKTLVVCMAQEPDTLYLHASRTLAARHVQHGLYDGPIDRRSYTYQPIILEKLPSIEDGDATVRNVTLQPGERYVNEAGDLVEAETPVETRQLIVTFKMKAGITWEDGTLVTARDSVYSFNLAADPDTPASRYKIARTASYQALDDLTTQWIGVPGFIDSSYATNFWTPLPEHAMGDLNAAEILKSKFARDPLSYGAFTLDAWVAGDHITLKKNSHYFRADEGLPKIDTVIFRFVPDANELLARLLAGTCDIGTHDATDLDYIPFLLRAETHEILNPHFAPGTPTGMAWEHITFNIWPADDRVPFGACRDVRQAIAYGTDRQAMVDAVLHGKGQVQHSYIPDGHPMYAAEIPTYEFDPERAKQILERAGWRDNDGDGTREAHNVTCERVNYETQEAEIVNIPNWTPLQMTLTTAESEIRERGAELFQQDMADIGVGIELKYLSKYAYFAYGPDGPLLGRRFDLAEFAWPTGVEPPGGLYLCDQVPTSDNGWAGPNATGWCASNYDQVTRNALDALVQEEQKRFWAESQRIFAENLPVLPLFTYIKVAVTRPAVTNVVIDPTESSEMVNIEEFDIAR